jgi:hypothetical protein
MSSQSPFSIRSFLRSQEALLVHFNTPMSTKHSTGFPDDLKVAKGLTGQKLSFCTVMKNDRGPWQGGRPADANAPGSVGIVVDVQDVGSVISVDWSDSGSIDREGSLGYPPGSQTCADSISKRTTSNEWWIQDYTSIGLFVSLPAQAFVKRSGEQGEIEVRLADVLTAFPDDRIFSAYKGSFVEFDRAAPGLVPISCGQIVPP